MFDISKLETKSLQQKLFLCIVFSRTKPCIRRRGAKVNNRKSLEKWRTHWCPPSSFQILSFSTLSHFWTDFLSSGHPLSVRYLCLFSFNSHNCKNIQSVPSPLFFKRMLAFFVLVKNKSVWGSLGYVILLTFFLSIHSNGTKWRMMKSCGKTSCIRKYRNTPLSPRTNTVGGKSTNDSPIISHHTLLRM